MKLAKVYNLKFTKVYINLEKYGMFFISWTLCQIRSFEFIRVERGAKFMTHFKGGASF
jgi:hypothetical protein